MTDEATALAATMLLDGVDAAPRRNVRLCWQGDRITAIEGAAAPVPARLVLPALADAHDHGRALRTVAFGAADQALELWIPALFLHPALPVELLATIALARLARAGYGSILAHVPATQRDAVRARWLWPLPPVEAQLAVVDEIARRCGGPLVDVQYGPVGPQWCSDRLLAGIAEAAARTGRRIHTHLFETRYQREWSDAAYPGGLLARLDSYGFLSDRLTVAHGVWLKPDECALLATRGVTVVLNTSSNLRLRSGLAPAAALHQAGVPLALGNDAMPFGDVEDGLQDLRLAASIHGGSGLERAIGDAEFLRAATVTGHRTTTSRDDIGPLRPGAQADFLVLDGAALAGDALADDLADPLALVIARGAARHIEQLVVAGRPIVARGEVLGVDLPALEAELAARAAGAGAELAVLQPLVGAYQAALRAFYGSGQHRAP